MLKWIADWWRFLLISMAIGAIAALAKRFPDDWIADSIVTFISLIGRANMIFDLIGRRSWGQRLQEKDREIIERDRKITAQNQEIADLRYQAILAQELAERDQKIAAQGQEISDLRQQMQELQQRANGQPEDHSEE